MVAYTDFDFFYNTIQTKSTIQEGIYVYITDNELQSLQKLQDIVLHLLNVKYILTEDFYINIICNTDYYEYIIEINKVGSIICKKYDLLTNTVNTFFLLKQHIDTSLNINDLKKFIE